MGPRFDRNRLIEVLRRDALERGTFILASGRRSHYYVDGRRVTLSAEGAGLIAAGILELLEPLPEVGAIGGLSIGADPIVGAVLALAPAWGRPELRGFLVRKEAKTHGTAKLVEGPLEPGSRVVIVDDVATTGSSSLQAIRAVEAMDCTVDRAIAVLDRLEGAAEALAKREIDFRSLVTIRDLGVEPLEREPAPLREATPLVVHPEIEPMPPLQGP
jgi:orotate phosphoribosyltransferase